MMRQQIMASSRMAVATMRNGAIVGSAPLARRSAVRFASSATKSAVESVKSDAPWAITSLVVFGGMFVYITSPPSGDKHAHPHSAADSHEKPMKGSVHEPDYEQAHKVERDSDAPVPTGDKKLAERSLNVEEGANKQRVNKDNPEIQRRDDSTFQHGVAAAKEGHKDPNNREAVISDPKKVVAAAKASQQDKKAKEKGEQPAEDDE